MLGRAADKTGRAKPTRAGLAQGIAMHESFGSVVAQVAEVSMKNCKGKVERVVCAIDCGVAVNPDGIKAQMEGGIGFALGALHCGEVEVKNGRTAQRNFDSYKSLRIQAMPKGEGYIVPSTIAPTGVGEPGAPPLAPAVTNTIAKRAGSKVRRLPPARARSVEA